MKKLFISALVGAIVLTGCKMPDIPLPNELMENMGLSSATEVAPSKVIADIKSNAYSAKQKWNGTRIAFTGTFTGSGKETIDSMMGNDAFTARVKADNGNGCTFYLPLSGAYQQQLSKLKTGQKVAVSAVISEYSFNYQGEKCPLSFARDALIKPL